MNKTFRRRLSTILAILLLLTLALPGCQKQPAEDGQTNITDSTNETTLQQTDGNAAEETTVPQDEKNELWIMWGNDIRTGWPSILAFEKMTKAFAEEYPDVSLRLETIPSDEETLQRLRTQIMAGDGPDVILMAENSTLISDPYQSMQNGLFMDLSEYYDADTTFQKEDLNETVMDAGVYNGKRYIIPFYYDVPTAHIDVAQFEAQGGNMEIFDKGVMDLYSDCPGSGVCLSDPSQFSHGFNFLPEIFDYEEQKILVTQEDVAQLLRTVQTMRDTELDDPSELPRPGFLRRPDLGDIALYHKTWRDYVSMYIGMMPEAVTNVCFSKLSGIEIAAIPITAADGDLVADVSYYGAVLNGCDKPELAYALLRSVLLSDPQRICYSWLSQGWSVLQEGSVDRLAGSTISTFNEIKRFYWDKELPEITESDLPFLNVQIDRVHFYSSLESELSDIIDTLNDPDTGAPTDVDIDAVAAEFVDELKWHLYEG